MSDNKMTPEWVVDNFLPDYETRLDKWVKLKELFMPRDFNGNPFPVNNPTIMPFILDNFPEALENFAKAQREICAEEWHQAIAVKGEPYYESINKAIRNAPMPEPENK